MDPNKLKPWVRRGILVGCIGAFVLLVLHFGWLRVPPGMNTMPDQYPPGTLCLVQKRPDEIPTGAVVFVDVGGGTVLTRVVRVSADRIEVEHDNKASTVGFGGSRGEVPRDAVRALVLTGLIGES